MATVRANIADGAFVNSLLNDVAVYGEARHRLAEKFHSAIAYGRTVTPEPVRDEGRLMPREVQEGLDAAAEELMKPGIIETLIEASETSPEARQGRAEPESVSSLRGWWEQKAHDEVSQIIDKMIEYGGLSRATDLAELGRGLIHSGVRVWETPADFEGSRAEFEEREHQELGVYFYLLGKFARWTAAVAEGRPVSDDTLLDIGVYVRMAQRIRAVGGWPV